MHLVRFADPWFGSYYKAECTSGGGPDLTIGPCFLRMVHMESLHNRGYRFPYGDGIEKSCQHNFVDGEIRGAPDPPVDELYPLPWIEFTHMWVEPWQVGPFSWTYSVEGVPDVTQTFECEWDQDDIGFRVKVQYRRDDQIDPPVGVDLLIGLGRVDDPNTEALVLVQPKLLNLSQFGFVGNLVYNIEECSNPFSQRRDHWQGADLPRLLDYIKRQKEELGGRERRDRAARDEAIYRAIDSLAITNVNNLEFLPELLHPESAIRPIQDILKGRGDPKSIIKVICSIKLWYEYYLKINLMTFDDLKGVLRWVWENRKALADSVREADLVGRGEWSDDVVEVEPGITRTQLTYSAKVCYHSPPRDFSGWIDWLNLLGATPRISDLWDIVRLSFVVDWFFKVESVLDQTELQNIQQRLDFVYGILGLKTVYEVQGEWDIMGTAFDVSLTYSYYDREVIDALPSDMWFGKLWGKNPLKQLDIGGALLINWLID